MCSEYNTDAQDNFFMSEALNVARNSIVSDDVPIGAVVVLNNKIIGRGYNQIEKTGDPTAHAELIAIKEATANIGYKHLTDCCIYVTLEPCAMCSGAIVLARIKRLIIGADDPKTGASGSLYEITQDDRLNHQCEITRGVLQNECSELIKDFFKKIRETKL